ncbi:tetraacyldisaccharide 4'-kinase [Legionella jordanis]|uniref:Tetraacyldisaccharide 4'-kinase n=1 Tax=Legionella jordanis TaxID=456 RepID=A0A0W0V9A5_9GAMM|nr:tetraacyldisaccharide 4'-kinase [Legionella jordanis]KTD16660.1 tetraacyldisaccharide 4'-kinase [Legionella jordanis]RMX03806.1 tetraacyldisaccharide 4'-kinase [Legionella jordanis]RMX22133.1 tetraacyldisaccharide 4'-kinase [Legionella jordanis]VEH11872.1 tetraacyldisaccharide 4'-kinase [Legionella jordanis]HAT8712819.1 tetraacyldisaccharide 4'-kinase [Legionella jordanis]
MMINPEKLWYGQHPLRWLLWPFSLIYKALLPLRRSYLQLFCQKNFPIPVIVVGNLTVGGVGKTPLVIALAKKLQMKGLRVGIVSRGYGAQIKQFPYEVSSGDSANRVGDEPLLMAQKTKCPVVIAPRRADAVRYLVEKRGCQVIVSDDGLQHYAMGRAIEIAVIDGIRHFGNGLCLPAGPLREGISRLKNVDFIVVNGGEWPQAYSMEMAPGKIKRILTDEEIDATNIGEPLAAVAGIGNPKRFFMTLHNLGISFKKYPFPDHHQFQPQELQFDEKIVVMTEKDAVKCRPFASDSWYYLAIEAKLSESFWEALWSHPALMQRLEQNIGERNNVNVHCANK